jgi:hypothetical protein
MTHAQNAARLALCALLLTSAPAAAEPAPSGAAAPAPSGAAAPAPDTAPAEPLAKLRAYVPLLEKARLFQNESASTDELMALLERASEDVVDGRRDEATAALLSVMSEPRYTGLADFPAYHTAELLLASLLTEDHALTSAQRIVDRMLARGAEQAQFGSAFRRGVDVALKRGDLAESAEHLARYGAGTPDTQSELAYLRGLAAYEAKDLAGAKRELARVGKDSRFYASAAYLLGAIAAQERRYADAEKHFCSVAGQGKRERFSFFVDGRFFPVRDLSWLGLGRVAHETRRPEDAFYYYFQVPNDSPRVAEALFEAAWASYEGRDHDTALDGLDQLDARFPRSPRAAEAAVLRGYVHLARCEFGAAERALLGFEQRFAPVVQEADQLLQSPTARSELYAALSRPQGKDAPVDDSPRALLLSLMELDPEFARLASSLRALDAELARSSQVPGTLHTLAQRMASKDRPIAPADGELGAVEALRAQAESAEALVSALAAELDRLERAGADKAELSALRKQKNQLDRRLRNLSRRALSGLTSEPDAGEGEPTDLSARLAADAREVSAARARALRLRGRLEEALDTRGLEVVRSVRERLADELRRARIGRVDAVMGAKRKLELEVESLAAGRFPPELRDVLETQSLLRDDEEYWPFEGDDWPDEFEERYTEGAP